jgi:hypothetical protein
MKVGIVAVHGVIPQIQHGFQDQVALALRDALDRRDGKGQWAMTVVLPANGSANASDVPTIARVHGADETDPDNPTGNCFDVHEAYWSPIDKGKTSFRSVLTWLMTTVFLPFNDLARYREHPLKACWDIGFILAALFLGLGALLVSALVSAEAMRNVICMAGVIKVAQNAPHVSCAPRFDLLVTLSHLPQSLLDPDAWYRSFDVLAATVAFILSPLTFLKTLSAPVVVALACGVVGGYLAFQVLRASLFIIKNIPLFWQRDGVQLVSRIAWTCGLAAVAVGLVFVSLNTKVGKESLSWTGLLLVVAVGIFNFGRNYLMWFVTSFFGDVQIYTTRDQNSDFFALREQILEKVVGTILVVLTGSPAGAPYDRVHVLAHSLGSTIAMDAILRLYDVKEASQALANPPLSVNDWNRIRSFITFGTSLEKTKYFFSVWNPTPSQDWEQWNASIYGAVFTADRSALDRSIASSGVYWLNCWFFSDFVSDEICTYRSFLLPGDKVSQNEAIIRHIKAHAKSSRKMYIGRCVAKSRSIFGPFIPYIQTHTHYLESDWFWKTTAAIDDVGVLEVISSSARPQAHATKETALDVIASRTKPLAAAEKLAPLATPVSARVEAVSPLVAKLHKSWEVVG